MPRKSYKIYTRAPHTRIRTPRDTEMSKTMRELKMLHPAMRQTEILSMAAKSLSKSGMGMFLGRRR